ncbi:hypothetical protein PSOL_00180 [Candidatus Phytoplasma solani]
MLLQQKTNFLIHNFFPTPANLTYDNNSQILDFSHNNSCISKQSALLITKNIFQNNKKLYKNYLKYKCCCFFY